MDRNTDHPTQDEAELARRRAQTSGEPYPPDTAGQRNGEHHPQAVGNAVTEQNAPDRVRDEAELAALKAELVEVNAEPTMTRTARKTAIEDRMAVLKVRLSEAKR